MHIEYEDERRALSRLHHTDAAQFVAVELNLTRGEHRSNREQHAATQHLWQTRNTDNIRLHSARTQSANPRFQLQPSSKVERRSASQRILIEQRYLILHQRLDFDARSLQMNQWIGQRQRRRPHNAIRPAEIIGVGGRWGTFPARFQAKADWLSTPNSTFSLANSLYTIPRPAVVSAHRTGS